MVLVDLPYGTTQNKWDSVIPLDELWKQYHRIVKKNGAMIFTASGLFTAELMLSNPREYKYNYTWIKSKATNFLNAKRQPLRKHEGSRIHSGTAQNVVVVKNSGGDNTVR